MAKVTYVGPERSRSIEIDKTHYEVERGETIDVPDELAHGDGTPGSGLLAQPDVWEDATPKPRKAAAKKAPAKRATAKVGATENAESADADSDVNLSEED